jgi:sugar transferase (PEP-CTERM/EpsH1 system associated)
MRILMLAHKVPYPLHDGYNLHNYHYSRELCGRHDIHLLTLGEGEPPEAIRGQFKSIQILPRRDVPRERSLLRRLSNSVSIHEVYDFDPAVHAAIESTLAREKFELVWISGAKMLVYTARLRGIPVLGDVADDGVQDTLSALRNSRNPRQLALRLRDYWVTRRFQLEYFRHFAVCNVVAEADRQSILKLLPGLDVCVINNGVDANYFAPDATPASGRSVVFEGSMKFAPNAEGAVHFCREILPLIREREPNVTVTIVGADPRPEVRALANESVHVTGFVPDVRPYLAQASVFVCPLLSGAGIKNKILQAWAMEKPVVATPISCGGLVLDPGRNLIVAEGRREFADAVLRLFAEPKLREELGRAGRRTVLDHYAWSAKARQMEQALQRTAKAPAG